MAGAWIVTCKGGRWTRLITKVDGLAYVSRLQHPTPPPTTFTPPAPPTTAPRAVFAPVTLPAPPSTIAPAPPLLYPNPPGVDLFLHDAQTGTTTMMNLVPGGVANNWSSVMDISADESELLIDSAASNLVPDDTNGIPDYFVVTLATGAIASP